MTEETQRSIKTMLTTRDMVVDYGKCCCWFKDDMGHEYYDPMFEGDYTEGQLMIVSFEYVANVRWVNSVTTIERRKNSELEQKSTAKWRCKQRNV